MKKQRFIRTEEQKIEDKSKILEALKLGLPLRRIVDDFKFPMSYVKKNRDTLVAEGAITKEDIKSAFDKYIKEHPAAQGLDKSKVRQKSNTEKADKRHAKSMATRDRVLYLLKEKNYSIVEAAEEIKISKTSVNYHSKKLIEEGKLTKEEIKKSDTYSRRGRIDKNNEDFIAKRDEVLSYLKRGWKGHGIRKVLNINSYDFGIYMTDIKSKKLITQEQIVEARQKKYISDLDFVVEKINSGYTVDQIVEEKPEFGANTVTPMLKELIDTGRITQEQIVENAKNARKQTMNENVKLSPEEQVQFIKDKVFAGYTPKEIVDSDKTKSITMHKVLYQKRKFIAEGIITQEEADAAMNKHKEDQLAKIHKKIIGDIEQYTIQGYTTIKEIADFFEYSYSYLLKIKTDYEKENGWFSKKQMKKFRQQRKIREAKELERRKKEKQREEEKQRKLAELEAKNKELIKKRIDKEEIKKLKAEYDFLKGKAKLEDRQEMNGINNVPVEARKRFIEVLTNLHKINFIIPEKDVKIVTNVFYSHPEFANKENIRCLISNEAIKNGYKSAGEIVKELKYSLDDTPYYNLLVEYGEWINKQSLTFKMIEMKKQNFSNTKIAEELGISSAEVAILLDSKKGDLPDFGTR